MKWDLTRKCAVTLSVLGATVLLMVACTPAAPTVISTVGPVLSDAAPPAGFLAEPEPTPTTAPTPVKTTQPEPSPASISEQTMLSPAASSNASTEEPGESGGTIRVRGGDTLERDIIPQLCDVFGLSDGQVKEALGKAKSALISDDVKGFRRMEGIIAPGRYEVSGETLVEYVMSSVSAAESRYETLAAACGSSNNLTPHQQLTLASIVEWECIGDEFEREAAAVFLNRLKKGDKLRSCATTEYALQYQRPYLTSKDVAVSDRYNTYQVRGLPPGPICAMDDNSLIAGISPAIDGQIYYFFYDYAPDTMQFFTSYDAFKAAAALSVEQFLQNFDMGKHDKISKRAVFGR